MPAETVAIAANCAAGSSHLHAVIFDVGQVLVDWDPAYLYAKLIPDEAEREYFLSHVATRDWHFQHDAGRPFAETSAELIAQHPERRALIEAWGPRWLETMPNLVTGMAALVADLDDAGVPLYALTNFSAEFWPSFRAREAALFDRFAGFVVSGEEKLTKPDPAIYHLALRRFGLAPHQTVFVDDRPENIDTANALGIRGILFTNADALRAELAGLGLLRP